MNSQDLEMNPSAVGTDEARFARSLQPVNRAHGRAFLESKEAGADLATILNRTPAKTPAPTQPHRLRHVLAGVGAVAVGLAAATYYFVSVAPYESTDDAFIAAHVAPVAPQVAGRVERLLVQDNEAVQQGEVLLQIDPRDYQVALDQARANLVASHSRIEQAQAQLAVDRAKIDQAKATVTAAEAEAQRAAADLKRFRAVGRLGVSASQLDLADTAAKATAAQVQVARNQELAAAAQAGLDEANLQTAAAEVQRNAASVRQAELDLSYTQVRAPQAGRVTHRTVEPGAYVQVGQDLLAIVPRYVWVIANFKETQLAHIRPGQPVKLKLDLDPQVEFKGHVDSIQAGTGAQFSLLPPENASGNYVKVVQRVPVKIVLDNLPADGFVLGPGMSVVPEIKVK